MRLGRKSFRPLGAQKLDFLAAFLVAAFLFGLVRRRVRRVCRHGINSSRLAVIHKDRKVAAIFCREGFGRSRAKRRGRATRRKSAPCFRSLRRGEDHALQAQLHAYTSARIARLRLPHDAHKLFDRIRVGRQLGQVALLPQPACVFGRALCRLALQAQRLEYAFAPSRRSAFNVTGARRRPDETGRRARRQPADWGVTRARRAPPRQR